MKDSGLSPETLAERVSISNMTIRRLLKRPPTTPLPPKYLVHFSSPSAVPPAALPEDFSSLLAEIEKSGEGYQDVEKLKKDVRHKMTQVPKGMGLVEQVKFLVKQLSTELPFRKKALVVGALLYFINPFDLIPDAMPAIGYLDDFAVMTLVIALLLPKAKGTAAPAAE